MLYLWLNSQFHFLFLKHHVFMNTGLSVDLWLHTWNMYFFHSATHCTVFPPTVICARTSNYVHPYFVHCTLYTFVHLAVK